MNGMTLRDLIIDRILFSCDNHELIRDYNITEDCLNELSDIDLFEIYEEVMDLMI